MADSVCAVANTTCVPVTQCPGLMNSPDLALTVNYLTCSFDEEASIIKICCPNTLGNYIFMLNVHYFQILVEKPVSTVQPPRFPVNGKARPCEDKHSMCSTWAKNGACKLDRHHLISDFDNNGYVNNDVMFNFMQTACTQSCGFCQDRVVTNWQSDIICIYTLRDVGMTIQDVLDGQNKECALPIPSSWVYCAEKAVVFVDFFHQTTR